jgi:dihydrolipoamide dehydrogenase
LGTVREKRAATGGKAMSTDGKVRETDVAVIGAGSAGLVARREAARLGARTLLIESGPYGTTCARDGCMPSKLLIAAADVAHEIAGAHRFGIEAAAPARVNGKAVLERVRRERDRFVGFVVEDVEALPEEARIRGRARFVGPTTLEVDGALRVEARAVVIATGSSPVVPDELEPARERLLTHENVFELEELPESLAVVGTGAIGLELGQAFQRLGVRTALFGRSGRLGPLTDPEVQAAARATLGRELDVRVPGHIRAEPAGAGVRLVWSDADGERSEVFDRLLVAAGSRPDLADLDLAAAGLERDAEGVPLHDVRTGQCGDSPVFIAGDVTDRHPLLHEAADDGRIAGRNAARFPDVRAHHRRVSLQIIFSDPQIALVGRSFADLEGERVAVGAVDYGDQGRARVMGKAAGLVRVYADGADGRLLGAEMLGPRVEHTAHLLTWAVQQGLTVDDALRMPFYHPVFEEGIRTAIRDAARVLQFEGPPLCARELDCGPGN